MLVKQIDTFEKAVQYVREQAQVEQEKERRKEAAASSAGRPGAYNGAKGNGRSGGNSRGTPRKPSIPIVEEGQPASTVSADELEELRKLARKLDGK